MILILGSEDDPHVTRVCDCLRAKGANFAIAWVEQFPVFDFGTVEFDRLRARGTYTTRREIIRLEDVKAIWYRRLFPPTLHSNITDSQAQRFALGEARAFLRGVWEILGNRPWMNPYARNQMAELKLYQLAVAQKVGLKVPRTLVTNDISKVLAFFNETAGDVVYKPLTSYATDAAIVDGKLVASKCVYTTVIRRESLQQFGSQVKLAPCLFQEYVPKQVELRITAVGNQFFTAAIHSQKSDKSKVDWRKYDLENTPYEPFELPLDVREKLRALLEEMGLIYGAIDCILRPDGDVIFLEINPGGQWLWVELLTGLEIGEAIANELIRLTRIMQYAPTGDLRRWGALNNAG